MTSVNASEPTLELPYGSDLNGQILFTSGPHSFGNTNGLAIVQSADSSGIDFAGGAVNICGTPANSTSDGGRCGFIVRSMAAGTVIYAGKGDFGNQVAVKLTTGQVIIYGHLFGFWPGITDALNQGNSYTVAVGSTIGRAGGTSINGQGNIINNSQPVHLHVELREGSTCTRLC